MRHQGFTFLEVILALALFSFGMMAVIKMFGVSAQTLQSGGHRTIAVLLAQEKLEELKSLPYSGLLDMDADHDGIHTSEEAHGHIRLIWAVHIGHPGIGLSTLKVSAVWQGPGGQMRSVDFATLRTDLDME